MGFFNEFPHTRTYDKDLGWLIATVKEIQLQLNNFIKINTIKYADPIIWNITTQYEANTVVVDGNDGTAYLSVAPVPTGVLLTNTDYWTPIFNLNLLSGNQNITFRDDGPNILASFASDTGDWIIWNFNLYRVTRPIPENTPYAEGYNIERYTVELFIKDYISALNGMIGDLDDLNTSVKTSIVNAINSILSDIGTEIGDLNDLDTSVKTSIVNAINSVLSDIGTEIGDLNDLTTSVKTSIVNAINSVLSDIGTEIGDLNDLTTSVKSSIVNAINSVLSDIGTEIGDLNDLDTSVKSSIVNAINSAVSDYNNKIGDLQDLDTTDKTSVVDAINEIVGELDNNTFVNTLLYPDMFTGTDTQKLQSCFDTLQSTGGIIVINRSLTITSDVTIGLPSDDVINNIKIIGIGNATITLTGCSFKGATDNIIRHCGAVQFVNLTFLGDGSNIFLITNYVIRCTFIGCLFDNFSIVFNNTLIMQSYVVDACIFRKNNKRAFYTGGTGRVFDLTITNSRAEDFITFVEFDTDNYHSLSCYNLNIVNCCIEGFMTRNAIRLQASYSVTIENNYFEANINTINLSEAGDSEAIRIENNLFNEPGRPTYVPVLFPGQSSSYLGFISGNHYNGSGKMFSGTPTGFINADVKNNVNATYANDLQKYLRSGHVESQSFYLTNVPCTANLPVGIDQPKNFTGSIIGDKTVVGVALGAITGQTDQNFTKTDAYIKNGNLYVTFDESQRYNFYVTVFYK